MVAVGFPPVVLGVHYAVFFFTEFWNRLVMSGNTVSRGRWNADEKARDPISERLTEFYWPRRSRCWPFSSLPELTGVCVCVRARVEVFFFFYSFFLNFSSSPYRVLRGWSACDSFCFHFSFADLDFRFSWLHFIACRRRLILLWFTYNGIVFLVNGEVNLFLSRYWNIDQLVHSY